MDASLTLGRFIREARLKRGMSLGQFAEAVGRSSSSVRRWERDEVAPAITIMPMIADVLAIDVGELEARRPALEPLDDTGPHTAGGERTSSTIEQPAVAGAVGVPEQVPDPTARQLGLIGELWNTVFANKTQWIGWVRGGFTVVFLLIMVLVVFWALGELFDSLKAIWDSFGTG